MPVAQVACKAFDRPCGIGAHEQPTGRKLYASWHNLALCAMREQCGQSCYQGCMTVRRKLCDERGPAQRAHIKVIPMVLSTGCHKRDDDDRSSAIPVADPH